MQWCHAYTVVSLTSIVWFCHTTPSILHWRESTLLGKRPNNGWKGTMLILLFLYQKEYQNYLSKVSCCKNIILCNFTVKSKLKLCRTMLLLYITKCRLLTRKLHKMEQSLMQQNGIWWVEYNSSMWSIAYCSCRAMIGHVLIRFWTLFSWYVFTMCIVSKGV